MSTAILKFLRIHITNNSWIYRKREKLLPKNVTKGWTARRIQGINLRTCHVKFELRFIFSLEVKTCYYFRAKFMECNIRK